MRTFVVWLVTITIFVIIAKFLNMLLPSTTMIVNLTMIIIVMLASITMSFVTLVMFGRLATVVMLVMFVTVMRLVSRMTTAILVTLPMFAIHVILGTACAECGTVADPERHAPAQAQQRN